MFFYTIRSHHHKTINLQDQTCPVCKNRGVLKMHLMQQYGSFIISFMPGGKYAIIDCDFCRKTVPNKLWTKELDVIYKQEKRTLKTPLKLWTGLILVLFTVLTLYTLYKTRIANPFNLKNVNGDLEINKSNVKNCKVGDVLFISVIKQTKTASAPDYTLAKVIKIEGDKTSIQLYSDKFEFLDQFKLYLYDLDDAKFKEVIEIKTDPLRSFGNLVYYNPPTEKLKFIAFSYASAVIQE